MRSLHLSRPALLPLLPPTPLRLSHTQFSAPRVKIVAIDVCFHSIKIHLALTQLNIHLIVSIT